MDLLPDDSIVISGKGSSIWPLNKPGTRPSFVKYNRLTGDRVCSILSEYTCMPDGMAVFTTATGDQCLAFSYGSVVWIFFSFQSIYLLRVAAAWGNREFGCSFFHTLRKLKDHRNIP